MLTNIFHKLIHTHDDFESMIDYVETSTGKKIPETREEINATIDFVTNIDHNICTILHRCIENTLTANGEVPKTNAFQMLMVFMKEEIEVDLDSTKTALQDCAELYASLNTPDAWNDKYMCETSCSLRNCERIAGHACCVTKHNGAQRCVQTSIISVLLDARFKQQVARQKMESIQYEDTATDRQSYSSVKHLLQLQHMHRDIINEVGDALYELETTVLKFVTNPTGSLTSPMSVVDLFLFSICVKFGMALIGSGEYEEYKRKYKEYKVTLQVYFNLFQVVVHVFSMAHMFTKKYNMKVAMNRLHPDPLRKLQQVKKNIRAFQKDGPFEREVDTSQMDTSELIAMLRKMKRDMGLQYHPDKCKTCDAKKYAKDNQYIVDLIDHLQEFKQDLKQESV